ncbi:hypothetical protein Rsub_06599 [Raphidocelis subcapitata]|uniref:Uncharacterized protein n=1 Tax=Raphidocelis subcapitata TaxID=307507 RepID=A0A2V0P0S5_9CHLO|nr:hypothetical protein Rsub_06599 [Raphidocelis subcapitata]|eukprot:GBF93466.1 hypothetical protein Rsub_06599 [Raphidocelis subcapitata]
MAPPANDRKSAQEHLGRASAPQGPPAQQAPGAAAARSADAARCQPQPPRGGGGAAAGCRFRAFADADLDVHGFFYACTDVSPY